jgi:hypothetical protein
MEAQTLAAIYAMAVVLLVAGQWIASLARGKVPELVTKPWEIRTHITAEALMALTLLGGGLAMLVGVAGGRPFLIPGLGMTLYSIVTSSGYYLQRRQPAPLAVFSALLLLTAIAAGSLIG